MGNSKGVLISKPILEQTGLIDAADLQVVKRLVQLDPHRWQRNPENTALCACLAVRDAPAFAYGHCGPNDHWFSSSSVSGAGHVQGKNRPDPAGSNPHAGQGAGWSAEKAR